MRIRKRCSFILFVFLFLAGACSGSNDSAGQGPAEGSDTSTSEPPVATSIASTTTTTIPPALDIDPTGEDFERIYRELEGAYDYMRQHPDAADPLQWFEVDAGGKTIEFMEERGYSLEPLSEEHEFSIDHVHVHDRVRDDYVQLWVETTSHQAGRRVLDSDGEQMHVDIDQLEREAKHVVGMRRVDGEWRIANREWVHTPEYLVGGSQFYVPSVLQPATESTIFDEGVAVNRSGREFRWEAHSYVVQETGEHCVEIRFLTEGRNVHCVDADEARRMRDGVTYAWLPIPKYELEIFKVINANVDIRYTVRDGLDEVQHPLPARSGELRVLGMLLGDFIEQVDISFEGRRLVRELSYGGFYCNQWTRNATPAGSVMQDYAEDGPLNRGIAGLRKDSRAELETYVLGEMYRLYPVPRVTIERSQPEALSSALQGAGEDAEWFVLKMVDWDWNAGDRTRTWTMTFNEDDQGWYLDKLGTYEECPGEPETGRQE